MSELSELLFSQGAAMNQAAASGIAAGEAKSQRRIAELVAALRLIAGGHMPNATDDSDDMEILFWSQALARAAIAQDALHD